MRSARRSGADTIGNLPCNVLDQILGRMPLKDAVKTSTLSKHWRYKWVTRQELEFDDNFFKSLAHGQEAKTIIYQVLLLHKGPILKFRLHGPNLTSCPDISHWIIFLSKKNVQEFTLRICSGNKYHLPSQLFTFQQLRHLEVEHCFFHPPTSFKGFDRLVNLDFDSVAFVPAILKNLISRCPALERLRLVRCTDLDNLEIDAANLKYFECTGKSKSICFTNAPILGKVNVYLYPSVSANASPVCFNLMKFFNHMPSLQELDICGCLLKYLTMGGVPENPPTALNNVKSLSIRSMSFENVEEVSGVIYLITSCPKLQELTFVFEAGNHVEPVVVQFLLAQSASYRVVKLLKKVNMSMFCGHEMEMELMRYILASSPVLEEIFIWNWEDRLLRPGSQMVDEMKQFPRASPNVEFIFEIAEVEVHGDIEPEDAMEVH